MVRVETENATPVFTSSYTESATEPIGSLVLFRAHLTSPFESVVSTISWDSTLMKTYKGG